MANGRLERREEAIDLALGYILMLVQAGKRQAWTPIRSHRCGFGVPVGCERLANGRLDRPEEAMDLALW